jgi:uncharacterized SAM-binding protein YcdF (DUF218 family)
MPTSKTLIIKKIIKDPILVETLVVTAAMLILSGGLLMLLAWLWVLRHALIKQGSHCAGVLLVCGPRLHKDRPTVDYIKRLRRAAELVSKNPDLRLLLLGGGNPSEAAAGRHWLLTHTAVPDTLIELEEQSINSFENLRHAHEMCDQDDEIYLLSSRYHLGRLRILSWQIDMPVSLLPAEQRLPVSCKSLRHTMMEAGYLCWFLCGVFWARLWQRKAMLRRLNC